MLKRLSLVLTVLAISACNGQQTPITQSSSSSSSSGGGQEPTDTTSASLPILTIDVMSREALVTGPIVADAEVDLLVSSEPDCRLAIYSTCANVQWIKNIRFPYTLKGLNNGQNYWGQLFQRGKAITKNTGFRPDALFTNTFLGHISVADNGQYFIFGGSKIGPHTGTGVVVDTQSGQPAAFPLVEGNVNSVISDNKGGWYIGGTFTSVGGIARTNIAHIDAKSQVTAFSADINGPVNKMALTPDGLIVLGQFSQVNLGIRKQIALLNPEGNLLDWKINSDGDIKDFIFINNTLYLAGDFTKINQISRAGVAAILYKGDLTNWNPSKTLGINLFNITTLAYSDSVFYLAGQIALPNQGLKSTLIAVDIEGKQVNFKPEITGSVSAVAAIQNTVYISGYFYEVNGEERGFMASLTKDGKLNPWNPQINAPALFIQEYNNKIYLAGHFDGLFGVRRSKFAALNLDGTLAEWNPQAAPDPDASWHNNSTQIGAQLAFWQDKAYLAANNINFFGGVERAGTFMLNHDGSLVDIDSTPQKTLYGRFDLKNMDTFEFNHTTCDIHFEDYQSLYSPECPKNYAAFKNLRVAQYDDVTAVFFQPDPLKFEGGTLVIPKNNDQAYIYPTLKNEFASSIGGLFQKDEIKVTEQVNNFISSYQIERIFSDEAGKINTVKFNHVFNGKPLKAAYFNNRIFVGGKFTKIGDANIIGLAAFTREGILIKSVKFPEISRSVTDIQFKGNVMYLILDGITTTTIDLSIYSDLINP